MSSRTFSIATFSIAMLLFSLFPIHAYVKPLSVVTTTEDLASVARMIGSDRVEVTSIARGYQDPHFVEAKPSYLLKLRSADLLIAVGLELEVGWLPALVQQSRNPNLLSAKGYLDASVGCDILQRSTGTVDRSLGDVHPYGNPHYWLDTDNGLIIASSIAKKLSDLRPADASYFSERLEAFRSRLTEAIKGWETRMAPYQGTKVVTYHNSWPNFAKRFGLNIINYVEPKPGIPPSPSHTYELIRQMKAEGIKMILVEPYFDTKTPHAIARETGAKVVVLPPSVGGTKEATDYFALFNSIINLLESSFKEVGIASPGRNQ